MAKTLTGGTVTLAGVPTGNGLGLTHPTFTTEVLATDFTGPLGDERPDSIEVEIPNLGRRTVWVGYVTAFTEAQR